MSYLVKGDPVERVSEGTGEDGLRGGLAGGQSVGEDASQLERDIDDTSKLHEPIHSDDVTHCSQVRVINLEHKIDGCSLTHVLPTYTS